MGGFKFHVQRVNNGAGAEFFAGDFLLRHRFDHVGPGDVHVRSVVEPVLLEQICAASVQGHGALFPESPPPMARLGRSRAARAPALKGSLCCDDEGFSLHAQVCVPAGQRERPEHLCRYVARPAIASERLALSPDGRVIYGLRRHWRDGTSAVSFDPLTSIERLAALVPRPRAHQHTYYGVLAPAGSSIISECRASLQGSRLHASARN